MTTALLFFTSDAAPPPDYRAKLEPIVSFKSETLKLKADAIKRVTFFRLPVYVIGFYLNFEKPKPLYIRLVFMRDVSKEELKKSWVNDIGRSCTHNCDQVRSEASKLAEKLPNIKSSDIVDYIIHDNSVDLVINGKNIGSLDSPGAQGGVLGAFIGPNSPSDVRSDLLKSNPKLETLKFP